MKELQSAVRQYQHNDCSGLVMGYDRTETELVVSNLLRERDELAAQVERLRGAIEHCVSAVEDTHYGWEGDCGVIKKVNVIADSVLDETPAQSLEAVKREWTREDLLMAMDYASGRCGSDDSAENYADAILDWMKK